MKPIVSFAIGLAIVCTATPILAQQPTSGDNKPYRHVKLDTNGDGVIDRKEAAANPRMAAHFDTLDVNKDGRITADERPHRGMRGDKGRRGERMAQLDADKDGRFSRAELVGRERMLQNFTAIDANNDGYLTKDEMKAFHQRNAGDKAGPAKR